MSTVDNGAHQPEFTPADELDALDNHEALEEDAATTPENAPPSPPSPRPLRIYTRTQILALLKSPLVSPPPNMPELKDWFGAENEQNLNKKDHEATPPNSARERRFRRDVDDGETSARLSYRSALSQPSQMGNFKHQSLRDRDGEKDRDLRDKEGQERLRNLSDKFDRDRLALPLSNLRNKDRGDPPGTRPAGASQLNGPNTRRTEPRENGKKKTESADDWRRGGEPRRGDREDRDRPRSRSRGRRDPSSKRDDRDRRDRDREDNRRDRDVEGDDSRRWRDDGRRDERVAVRRDRDHKERWPAGEDRDSRTKRPAARDKKIGEDGKEAADRRADREKEKEPAWMDTYVPSPTSSGILGGKGADGELDGIQAWKKGMKEKERAAAEATEVAPKAPSEKPLDEIQLFKMMMKREQLKGQDGEEDISLGPKMAAAHKAKDVTSVPTLNTEPPAPSAMPVFSLNEQNKPSDEHVLSSALSPISIGEPESASSAGAFNPPPGPRLLALGRVTAKSTPPAPVATQASSSTTSIKRPPPQLNLTSGIASLDNSDKATFSPFDEQRESPSLGGVPELQRRERPPIPSDASWNDPLDPGMVKGSRFAKFFDGKVKEAAPTPKLPPPSALSPPIPVSRPEHIGYQHQQPPESRTVDDLFAMITAQAHQRAPPSNPPSTAPGSNPNHMTHQQIQSQLHLLQQQQRHQQQQQQQQQLHHLQQRHQQVDSLYENRLDNRNFMPDNMVPGLRSAPPPRNGDNGGMFSDPLDEVIHINAQRPPIPLHRGLDPLYSGGGMPPYASQQSGRGAGIPVQYRGGPSPIGNQNGLGRLPPGLANLGGRPPHEPSQFSGLPGLNSAALHGGPINPPQSYNNYSSMGPGFNNGPPRGMPPQISGNLAQHQLAGLGHQNLMDLRNHNMNPPNMLNLGGGPLNAGRGMSGGYPGHGGQPTLHNMRQPTQQPPLPSHVGMMPQQHLPPPQDAQSANLMALLLGHRPNVRGD